MALASGNLLMKDFLMMFRLQIVTAGNLTVYKKGKRKKVASRNIRQPQGRSQGGSCGARDPPLQAFL